MVYNGTKEVLYWGMAVNPVKHFKGKELEGEALEVTVDIILLEMQIRIEKLKEFEFEAEKKRDVEMHRINRVRRMEYESFKNWIEVRIKIHESERVDMSR